MDTGTTPTPSSLGLIMANVRGLKIPIGVGPTGRTETLFGDAQSEKIIRLGLSDTDNENAFQQNIGLGLAHVFDVNRVGARTRVGLSRACHHGLSITG